MPKLLEKGRPVTSFALPAFSFFGTKQGRVTPCYWLDYPGANRWNSATPPFLRGVSRLIDPCSLIRHAAPPESPEAGEGLSAAWIALAGDWERIGRDMWTSISIAADETGTTPSEAFTIGWSVDGE